MATIRRHAQLIGANDEIVKYVRLCEQKPRISTYITQQRANTVDEMLEAARLAELTSATASSASDSTVIMDQIAQLKTEVRHLGRDSLDDVQPSRSPTPERRRVTFEYTGDNVKRPSAVQQKRGYYRSSGGNQ